MNVLPLLLALALTSTAAIAEAPESMSLPPAHQSVWSGQEITFANGAKIVVKGSTLTTTAGGATSMVERGTAAPPPRIMASCSYMRHWLDTHPVNNNWRANSLTYADRCF